MTAINIKNLFILSCIFVIFLTGNLVASLEELDGPHICRNVEEYVHKFIAYIFKKKKEIFYE